ncbi:CaiB/BaiF CoA transferase family protein [Thermodesulfobacteriota bacterium]
MINNILQGLRVLDFTRVLAGPYTTRILADFGAEVIKVQSKKTARGAESNLSPYFCSWNRNKRSIMLDMSHPEAKTLAMRLVKISDVVVENYSPRVMSNWGMEYESLRKVNEKLIMLSMSGMGQTGPWKDYVSFGPTIQALGGLTFLTSFTENEPLGIGFSYGDPIAGLYGVVAILAALEYRDATGLGEYIDLSQYEAIATTIGPALMELFAHKKKLFPAGNCSDTVQAAPYEAYRCSGEERWCVIAVFTEEEWRAFSAVLDNPAWTLEKRFATLSKRKAHKSELDELIGYWTIEHKAEKVVDLLQKAGVNAGVVQNAEDLAKDPHLLEREFFTKLNHPGLGELTADSHPIRFADQSGRNWKPAPLLGEDNRYVYGSLLGLSEKDISLYMKKGVIA